MQGWLIYICFYANKYVFITGRKIFFPKIVFGQQLPTGDRSHQLILSRLRSDRFSQNGEALSALHEAIQMAQEAGDAICLQYALGWLHLITEQVDGEGP